MRMRIFLDTCELKEVKRWLPIISGVTTNPSLLEKQGGDLKELADFIYPLPVSIEACGDFVKDAGYWNSVCPNAVIKIPILNTRGEDNLKIISQLAQEGIPINCTALMSLSQIILALEAGARYASLFAGRIDDEGGDFKAIIQDAVELESSYVDWLIVGSIRTVGNVLDSVRAGAHIVTIPPSILEKMVKHEKSLRTVVEFEMADERLKRIDYFKSTS